MKAYKTACLSLLIATTINCGPNMLPTKDAWYAMHYFIMQKFENDAYKAMTPEARLKFQELFWAVRSPAVKKEFDIRMEYINKEFKNENSSQPWNTDRARIYLLNGSPGSRDYTTDDRWGGNPAGRPTPEGLTDDRMGEDVQARTMEVWKFPIPGGFFALYGFAFNRPNKWKQANPSTVDARYVGQLELRNRKEVWGAQDEGSYKKRIAELISGKNQRAEALIAPPPAPAQTKTDVGQPFDLAAFLKTAADYCGRLESVALYFTCREEILEKVDLSRDAEKPPPPTNAWAVNPSGKAPSSGGTVFYQTSARSKNSLVYDYQCIRNYQGVIRDTRTLIEQNGKKKHVPEAKLETKTFYVGTPLLGPTGIFAERNQKDLDFAVVGRETIDRKPAVIVEAKRKPGLPPSRFLLGKAWVDLATNEILKIEWDESRVGSYEIFKERGEKYKLDPKITVVSEFSVEKSGLRFPTKMFLEEAYLNDRGRKWVRAETTVEYTDFKFFTVDVDIK